MNKEEIKAMIKDCVYSEDGITYMSDKQYNNCINIIEQLQQENSRLKEELEELKHKHYLIQGGRGNGKTYLLHLQQENQELKKQIEYLRRSIERKEEAVTELERERVPYVNEYVEKLKNQQKEFVKYLENEKYRLAREYSRIYVDSLGKTRLVNTDIVNEVDKILSKYKESCK